MRYTFKKSERLKSEKTISALFAQRQSVGEYPFRLFWLEATQPLPAPIQMAFSAPKKKFKTAVARNRIKRCMREAYRLCKEPIYGLLQGKQVVGMLLYVADKEEGTWEEWQQKMERLLRKMVKQLTINHQTI